MGDEAPCIICCNIGIMGGDIHVRIFIQKHHLFERKGADIFIEKQISLIEALTGTNFEIEHLDVKKYKVLNYIKDLNFTIGSLISWRDKMC